MKQLSADHEGTTRGRALAVLGLLVFCLPLIGYGLREARFDGRLPGEAIAHRAFPDQFPDTSDHLLVSWQGSSTDDPRIPQLVDRLLGTPGPDGLLRNGSPLIASAMTPGQVLSAIDSEEVPTDEAARRIAGLWLGRGGLKLQLTDVGRRDIPWTMNRIRESMAGSDPQTASAVVIRPGTQSAPLGDESSAVQVRQFDLEAVLARDHAANVSNTALRELLLQARGYATAEEPQGQRLVAEAFEAIGSPVALRVVLSSAGKSSLLAAEATLRDAAEKVGIRPQDLQISGRALEAAQSAGVLRKSVWSPSDRPLPLLTSPVQSGIAVAFLVWLVLGRFSLRCFMAGLAAVFASAAFAAGVNFAGASWSSSLLGLPPLVFALVLAFNVLDRAKVDGDGSHSISLPVALAAVVIIGMLCVSDLSRSHDRLFAVAGSLGVLLSWLMAVAILPHLFALTPAPAASCPRSIWEFSHWATTHKRAAAIVATMAASLTAAVLLQPGARLWLSCNEVPADVSQDSLEIERTLGGSGHLTVAIRFTDEARQRMRFAQRAAVVREATENIRACAAVTGAFSIADIAPSIDPLPEDARPRDRANYVRKSNAIEDRLRKADLELGSNWILPAIASRESDAGDDVPMGPETWRVDAALLRDGVTDPQGVLRQVDAALQQVFRFHAGVSHSVTTDLSAAEASVHRMPRVAAAVLGIAVVAASLAASSLAAGIVLSAICIVPILALVLLPGLAIDQVGPAEWLAIVLPGTFGLMSTIDLAVRYRAAIVAGNDRCEALARSLAAGAARRGALLMALVVGSAVLSLTTPAVLQPAARLTVVAGLWSLVSVVSVAPLLLAAGMGRWLAKSTTLEDQPATTYAVDIPLPVRLDEALSEPIPHIELPKSGRRSRRAG